MKILNFFWGGRSLKNRANSDVYCDSVRSNIPSTMGRRAFNTNDLGPEALKANYLETKGLQNKGFADLPAWSLALPSGFLHVFILNLTF